MRLACARVSGHPLASLPRVPNQPKTPKRTIRVPDELWQAAKDAASDNAETVTDVILRALVRYVRENAR